MIWNFGHRPVSRGIRRHPFSQLKRLVEQLDSEEANDEAMEEPSQRHYLGAWVAGQVMVPKGYVVVPVNPAWLFGLDSLQSCSFAAAELLNSTVVLGAN